MNKIVSTLLMVVAFTGLQAQEEARWLRYPAVSPDGEQVVFGFKGNLYKVSTDGGMAVAITTGDHYNKMPVWSPDGQYLAFASDRNENFDVFVMPVNGGQVTQLTHHSADDLPFDFTPDNRVVFGGGRNAPASSVRFPNPGLFKNVYTVPLTGGRPVLLTAAGVDDAHMSRDGNYLVFQDRKGYENDLRKHHTSSVTRDVWIYDIRKDDYRQLSEFEGENREPVLDPAAENVFFLSEKDGTQNVYKKSLTSGPEVQLTAFKDFPVRDLSVSDTGLIVFSWKGDIYTMREGENPEKLGVAVATDASFSSPEPMDINSVTEFALSPNGKEIAFVNRGEVFVTGIDDARTKRITNTAEQERMISWSPKGDKLLFSGERNGSWNIYEASVKRVEEKYFYPATLIGIKEKIASAAEEFQAKYSPDGTKIAYIEERNILKVIDVVSGKTVTILPEGRNFSYSDGDWGYQWSPDSKWLLVDDSDGYAFSANSALIKADGSGEIFHPVNSGFGEYNAKWILEGKAMAYENDRYGRRSLAMQGSREVDIFAVFFDQEAYDRFILSEEDFKLLEEVENGNEKASDKKESDKSKEDKKEAAAPLKLDLKGLDYRKVRLTINSSSIRDYALNKDGSKLFYLTAFEKGYDLWVTEPRTKKTKILAKMGGSPSGIEFSKDEKFLILSNRGKLVKVDTESGKISNISIDADMMLDAAGEREYMFDHAWRQVKKKFYDPGLHGVDWDMYYNEYSAFLPYINNNYDFQDLLSELLGELNASHTGGRFRPDRKNDMATAYLGVLFDQSYQGAGMRISEVLKGGPLDNAGTALKPGDIIENINGNEIGKDENWYRYLNGLKDKNTYLKIRRGNNAFETSIKPVSAGEQRELMYRRWVNTMEAMVDSLSNGKLGYIHVRGMNDGSFREVYGKAMGKHRDKAALVVDTRFNGGGWLHDDLNTFFSGERYLEFKSQGNDLKIAEPVGRWTKPSIVVMSESNYSDAFIFPYIYKQNGLGKLVGMPVPGTGTAVWWERMIDPSMVFGIPMISTIGEEGRATENLELQPDIMVPLPYKEFLNGRDTQIEAAVRELMQELGEPEEIELKAPIKS